MYASLSETRRFVRPGTPGKPTIRRTPFAWGHLLPWVLWVPGNGFTRHALDGTRWPTQRDALAALDTVLPSIRERVS